MTDLLDPLSGTELSQLASTVEVVSFGPATGLARASHCLAAASASPLPLRLLISMADNPLRDLESMAPGTDHFLHKNNGNRPHRLDQDVRRLRLRLLANHMWKGGLV